MVELGFNVTQWTTLIERLEDGQGVLTVSLQDLQGALASIASLEAEQLVVLRQIRDKLPEV